MSLGPRSYNSLSYCKICSRNDAACMLDGSSDVRQSRQKGSSGDDTSVNFVWGVVEMLTQWGNQWGDNCLLAVLPGAVWCWNHWQENIQDPSQCAIKTHLWLCGDDFSFLGMCYPALVVKLMVHCFSRSAATERTIIEKDGLSFCDPLPRWHHTHVPRDKR